MPRTYECPCCHGCGLTDCDPRRDESEIFECEECEGTGRVSWACRQELLAWQRRTAREKPAQPPERKRA
jgi:DnaJ-class molecular chaperone